MSVAADVPSEVRAYLAAVRESLADLPPDERDDLLSEVEASLAEAAAEGEQPLTARLGPPSEFAAELRAAAGLHTHDRSQRWHRLGLALRRLQAEPWLRSALGIARELAPVWWVARGYLAVAFYAVVMDTTWLTTYPIPRLGGTAETGALVIAAAVVVSIWVGGATRRASRRWRGVVYAANVLVLLTAPAVVDRLQDRVFTPSVPVVTNAQPGGLTFNGQRVQNIYPYSRDGKLLHDVLLFDSSGQPLVVTGADPQRRYLKTPSGRTIFNSFPIRYFEPGTKRVANPDAAPRVWLPPVATPPLTRR